MITEQMINKLKKLQVLAQSVNYNIFDITLLVMWLQAFERQSCNPEYVAEVMRKANAMYKKIKGIINENN